MIQIKRTNRKHGLAGTPFYSVWYNMKSRCFNENVKEFKFYGGRGITVCKRWLNFINFKDDMHISYLDHKAKHETTTIERKDNYKGYCPDNCCWATQEEQKKNLRRVGNIRKPKNINENSIMIRGLQNKIWMKFRALCKEQEYSANYGVKKLIREYVEKSGGEKWI